MYTPHETPSIHESSKRKRSDYEVSCSTIRTDAKW